MKLREVLKSDITSLLLRWRYGPLVIIAIWIGLHILLGYEVVTGQMRLRWRLEWIEGRESAPVLYWIYIAGSAGVLMLVDVFFLRSAFSGGRKKEADPDRQRTTRGM